MWHTMTRKTWQCKIWLIFLIFIGASTCTTQLILANNTLGLKDTTLSAKNSSDQTVTVEESKLNDHHESNVHTFLPKLPLRTTQEVNRGYNDAKIQHHPYMTIIYEEIHSNKHQKWTEMMANGASIRGIEPIIVKQEDRGKASMEFNTEKTYDMMDAKQAMLILPMTGISEEFVYPKRFKMVLSTNEIVLCEVNINSYQHSTYTIMDLTVCIHQQSYPKRFRPDNTFKVELNWTDTAMINIGRPLLVLALSTKSSRKQKYQATITKSQMHHRRLRQSDYPSMLDITEDSCALHELYLTLEDLQLDSWVIAPPEFTINYCSGICAVSFVDILHNTTNNAVVRSMLLAKNPQMRYVGIPQPHCVPMKLGHADFMFQEAGEIIIEKLENITAENCGCL